MRQLLCLLFLALGLCNGCIATSQPMVVDSEPAVPIPVTRDGAASDGNGLAQEIEQARAACAALGRTLVVESPTTSGAQDGTPQNTRVVLRCIIEK